MERDSRRAFNQTQKAEIWDNQDGLCANCGKKLQRKATHYDHKIPWEKEGKTDVKNGQALCANCHAEKSHNDRLQKIEKITKPSETPLKPEVVTELKDEKIIDSFRHKFEMHYSKNDINEIFDTIRTIHMGIRYEADLTDSQLKSINALVQFNLINRFRDKGYYHVSISNDGKILANKLVEQYIDNNSDTLNKILTKYSKHSNKILGCALYALIAAHYGSYRPSLYQKPPMFKSFSFNYNDEPFVNEKIIDKLNTFFSELIDAKFAVKSISGNSYGDSHTCEEVLIRINEIANKPIQSIGKAIVTYRVIRTIEQFYRENQNGMPNTRTQLDAQIRSHNSSIEGIKKYLELANKRGYTSKLNDDAPVIIFKDIGTLINETFTQIGKFILDESYDTDLILNELFGMDYLANTDIRRRC